MEARLLSDIKSIVFGIINNGFIKAGDELINNIKLFKSNKSFILLFFRYISPYNLLS